MVKLPVRLMVLLLNTISLFISRKKYVEKVENIKEIDEKNGEYDLDGWKYKKAISKDGSITHRYYYYPCKDKNAPVCIFLHGINFDGRVFLKMKSLAAFYTLIAYDFPEESDKYNGKIDGFVSLLKNFIDTIGLKIYSLIGNSFGGIVALRFAAENPSAAGGSLIVISTPLAGSSKKEICKNILLDNWMRSLPDYKLYWLIERAIARFKRRYNQRDRLMLNGMLKIKKMGFYRQVSSALREYSAINDAKKLDRKVLIIQGGKDSLFSPDEAEKFRKFIPQVETQIIKDGTHAVGFFKGEGIAKRIREFYVRAT